MNDAPHATRIAWQEAVVSAIVEQTPRVKSFFLKPENWTASMAGQHVDIRLSAPDGYQAQRSYSIASAPGADAIELVIERLEDGEVSPFFHQVVEIGDAIEMRGPIGGHFIWRAEDAGPLLLVGGGSGVAPLMSILRHRAAVAPDVPTTLVYSARHMDDVIFRDELLARAEQDPDFRFFGTITREKPSDPSFRAGRIDRDLVAEVLAGFGRPPRHTFVCGANAFVDTASRLLIDMGVAFNSVRAERYGGDPAREATAVVPGA